MTVLHQVVGRGEDLKVPFTLPKIERGLPLQGGIHHGVGFFSD